MPRPRTSMYTEIGMRLPWRPTTILLDQTNAAPLSALASQSGVPKYMIIDYLLGTFLAECGLRPKYEWMYEGVLDLREIAADKGLIDVRQLGMLLEDERRQYDALKLEFDQRIENVRQGAVDEGLKEVQRQLESVDAKLAKDQILRILASAEIPPETFMNFVVTMFKNMPLDRKKKIMGEFKTAEERQQLNMIMNQIRLGVPDVEVIRQAREQFEAFNTRYVRR